MNYTIFGCITKYTIDDIKPYVESINQSGFNGKKVMLVYDIDVSVIEYLKSYNWELYGSILSEHIILQRFRDGYSILDTYIDDVIIWTDVKDVIFQRDPIEWIKKHKEKEIMAFSECVIFKDDDWACVNAGTSFPLEWKWLQYKTSYCAGTIIADARALKDLFIEIYRWSRTTANPGQLSDQAAYNVLINLNHFKENVQFVNQEEGGATQLGTVFIKKDTFGDKLLEPTPKLTHDDIFTTQNDEIFVIVHQYDRDSNLKLRIQNKYK